MTHRCRRRWSPSGAPTASSGESPRRTAVRELLEESGQEPDGPWQFIGYAGFVRATIVRDFRADEEIAAIRWWNLQVALPGRVQTLDAYLARLTREWHSGLSQHPESRS
ncbi:NUDIX domain-containing protein [Streptomyces canus]|uniref:NUDIX domain-containing protein n=1 Tax=Streptomyces canus TaxID=58343 RepID=UPI0033A0BAB5